MIIGLISDIHGNLSALEAVLKSIQKISVNAIYCLGDIAGYYTEINECCTVLQDYEVECILGNHDWYLAAGIPCPRSKSANDCLNYQQSVISEKNRKWLSSFPLFRIHGDLTMVHGGWTNPLDEYLIPTAEQLRAIPSAFGCSGHTHIQGRHEFAGKAYCNPGSVGQPRDNDCRAAYATFGEGKFDLHRVEYDIEKTCRAMQRVGFSEYYYKRLRTGAAHFQL